MPTSLLADYEDERRAFDGLLAGDCHKPILLFHGESGCGKTTLVKACLDRAAGEPVVCAPIQLRGSAVGVAEIFYRAGGCLGWERLSRFTEQVAAFQGAPDVRVDHNFIDGIDNRIDVALRVESPADRAHRRAALTESWFGDLRGLGRTVLLAFDTYEAAATEVREWIDGPLLARAARPGPVRVLLAGQEVPDAHNIEWGSCCASYHLCGVPESEHWLPIVDAMGRWIDAPDPLSWLAGVCVALEGRPREIIQVIEGLPRKKAEGAG